MLLKSTAKLVDDDLSNTIALGAMTGKKGERKRSSAVTSSLSFKILANLGNVSKRLSDHLKGSQFRSPSRRNQDPDDDNGTIIVTFHSAESQEVQGSDVNSDAAVAATAATAATTAANTTLADAPSIANVGTIIEPPAAKVSITTLANDNPTFIGVSQTCRNSGESISAIVTTTVRNS